MAKVTDFDSIKLQIASPEQILDWSYGEVSKPETINYRTKKPEKDGLFDERIFGPEKDYECYCGKYRKVRYKGVVCDRCGVEVTRAAVRRERMGHIKLAVPVAHIWFMRVVPSRIGLFLDIPVQQLEKVVYYASYVVRMVDERKKEEAIKAVEEEYRKKVRKEKSREKNNELRELRDQEQESLNNLKPRSVLSEIAYHNLSLKYGEIFTAGTGAETLYEIMRESDLSALLSELKEETAKTTGAQQQKAQRRLNFVQKMLEGGIRPEWMFLTVLPVMPPELRPMVQLDGGRYATSDLNDLYRRVINRNNRLKRLLELNAPEVITRNEKRMLQEAVDALIDNSARRGHMVSAAAGGRRLLKSLADMLQGKQGRFRQNLLGKRVDYSARSVIVIGPELDLNQCGLPKKMALELFRPFVIQKILEQELAFNVRAANHLIDDAPPEVWAILEEVIKGKYVLLNRAPTLHRLGVQAFEPVLVEGNAIQIHPLVCVAYNADFDGDQMAVHLPLSNEAQEEARQIMLSSINLTKPATGEPIVSPTRDIVLGTYWMSKIKEGEKGEGGVFSSPADARLAYETGVISLKAEIRVRDFRTCAGRIIFNEALPADFGFVNEDLSSKVLKEITARLLRDYGAERTVAVLDAIKNLGFYYATVSGLSWAMGDLTVPKEKRGILQRAHKEVDEIRQQFQDGLLGIQERRNKIIEIWTRARNQVADLVHSELDPHGPVAAIVASGARGSWSQPIQMMGMKGLVANPAGQTMELPVEASFKEGFTALEYFISTHGARKGTADTALRTAKAGYLTRRLVDVAQDLIVQEEDCGEQEGFLLRREDAEAVSQSFAQKIFSRNLLEDIPGKGKKPIAKKGAVLDYKISRAIEEDENIKEIRARSPLSCKSVRGICTACYGWDLGRNAPVQPGEAVGVIAAQAIGEPGTQLTMRTFHTGGVAGGGDITQGLPRVEEIFEARPPRGLALISDIEGKVEDITEQDTNRVIKISYQNPGTKKAKKAIKEFIAPLNIGILVNKGEPIMPGTQLTEGHIDLKDLFQQAGKQAVQRYIVNEVQKIYSLQGATIHDKHIETIVRQMFSRQRILNPGDSKFISGDIVEHVALLEEKTRLRKAKKKEATAQPLLLGITKVALTTESFLSAASFQETSRILVDAAISGKEDKLRGLKENVIIGKLIPAGTGYKK